MNTVIQENRQAIPDFRLAIVSNYSQIGNRKLRINFCSIPGCPPGSRRWATFLPFSISGKQIMPALEYPAPWRACPPKR